MSDRASPRFDPGVRAWLECLGSPRDTIRQQLVSRQLAAHLPRHPTQLAVLDAGCGQGTQAMALASLGHDVTGIDISETLLEAAQGEARRLPDDVRRRIRFERGDVLDLGPAHRGRYDVVCCHGVAMYLPSLAELVRALFSATRPGGIVSLLTRNQAGIAMRAGMSREWSGTLAGFDAAHYTNRLGIEKVRADDPADVRHAIDRAGGEAVHWYGVRLFTDHWPNEPAPDIEEALAAEEEAGRRDPYRALAALTHTLATAPPNRQTTSDAKSANIHIPADS
ncbi:MAG TPA: methyltransferase domain-containing protein [Solirubrobacteraceae bacterium]|jgi:S-adenosylmethionine-dependent methyltransferase|nr:methyltransferase domain-containing protein [Solirubrobacteraceae bacterium]